MKITRYQDNYFFYFWKPYGIPSTFGKQKCFLDYLNESDDQTIKSIIQNQKLFFSDQEEWGLVNRLDNDTTGLLYLAKTPLFKQKYKQAQSQGEIHKTYIADVYGKILRDEKKISYPITHHKFLKDRMVVISDTIPTAKIDPKRIQKAETIVKQLYYDSQKNVTTLSVTISKGVRHQIRAHLSSIGHPIVGEKIYIKNPSAENLHLFSVGLSSTNHLTTY